MYWLFFGISLAASIVGAICGIGGGVVIKPVLDAVGVLDVAAISFLSGCTVLAMSLYSVATSWFRGEARINLRVSVTLSIGAALGGIVGKQGFSRIWIAFENKNMPGLIQAVCLLALTAAAFVYMLKKGSIRTKSIGSIAGTGAIGLVLGLFSSFLGIGGGPINLVVLYYFFSMETGAATENSLFIILFSQITSLLTAMATHAVPAVDLSLLALMIAGGIGGGIIGKCIKRKIVSGTVERLFMSFMAVIIAINIYNIVRFSQ